MPRTATRTSKSALLDQIEAFIGNIVDNMTQLAEYPMESAETKRLHKICDVILDLRRAMWNFTTAHDDILDGRRTVPAVTATRRSRRTARRASAR